MFVKTFSTGFFIFIHNLLFEIYFSRTVINKGKRSPENGIMRKVLIRIESNGNTAVKRDSSSRWDLATITTTKRSCHKVGGVHALHLSPNVNPLVNTSVVVIPQVRETMVVRIKNNAGKYEQ